MLLKIPATSANLGPGFDCIGMALNLYNYIDFEVIDGYGKLEIEVKGEGADELSKDKDNLVYQAYERVFLKLSQPVPGIRLKMENSIPLARGLGSSSAAVVGGLAIANKVLNNALSIDQLLALAVELEGHPDNVAPALIGGIVLCGSNGQKIMYDKIIAPKGLYCSVLIPDYELSTKKARDVLPRNIALKDAVFNISRMGFFVHALHTGDLEKIKYAMEDKLHQPFRSQLIPGLTDVFVETKKMGLLGAAISGAGPSIIIFHRKEQTSMLKNILKIMDVHNIKAKILNLEPVAEGVKLIDKS